MSKRNKLSLIIIVVVLISTTYAILIFKDEAKSFVINIVQKELISNRVILNNFTTSTPNSTNQQEKIIENAISILQSPPGIITGRPITIDTSDWLTYRNEKYGYEINYPKETNISVINTNDRITLNTENFFKISLEKIRKKDFYENALSLTVVITVKENTKNLSPKEWFYRYGPISKRMAPYPSLEKELVFADETAYYVEYEDNIGGDFGVGKYVPFFIYIRNNTKIYIINGIKIPDKLTEQILKDPYLPYIKEYIPIAEAIIQSFKFLK